MRTEILNSFSRKLLLAEAMLYLILAKLALMCLSFKTLKLFMNRFSGQPELQGEEREVSKKAVRWSILRATNLLPGKATCFPRAIAAQAMLRRRRINTTLYYGAETQAGKGLASHVWVKDGSKGVIGLRAADGYKIIAKFPE